MSTTTHTRESVSKQTSSAPSRRRRDAEKPCTTWTSDGPQPTKNEIALLESYLDRGKRERIYPLVRVTPGLANWMLRYNTENRTFDWQKYRRHSNRLKTGIFVTHHQGVSFSKQGIINDGQHRLIAIRDTGIGADVFVMFGANRDEVFVTDRDGARTSADDLSIQKYADPGNLAALARQLIKLRDRETKSPDPEIVTAYARELDRDLSEAAIAAGKTLAKYRLCSATAAALAFYWIKTRTTKPAKADEFWLDLGSGEGLHGLKLTLREFLKDSRGQRSFGLSGDNVIVGTAGVIINAFNSFVARRRTFMRRWQHVVRLPDVA